MIRLMLLIACTALFAVAHTQTLADYEEVIYLKNGSVIRGIIIEEIPSATLKIQTREQNIFVYRFDEIEKLTKELYRGGGGSRANSDTRKQKGFNVYIDQGVSLWITPRVYPMNFTEITLGYKVNRLFFIGGSTGIYARQGFLGVPVAADVRLTLTKTKVAPLINLKAGYISPNILGRSSSNSFVVQSDYGGFLFGFRPGLGVNLKKDVDLNFFLGYILGSQIVNTSSYFDSDLNLGLMHMFNFSVGVKF